MVKELTRMPFDGFASNVEAVFERIVCENETVLIEKERNMRAILKPVVPAFRPRPGKSAADYEAFLASAGGWRGLVDTDKLIANIYESRRRSSRPPVEL